MNYLAFIGLCALAILSACKSNDGEFAMSPEQKSSEYVLPYPIGKTYTCSQGWYGLHQGVFTYGVDFSMPIGSTITAARGGRVIYIAEHFSDNDKEPGKENILIVMHSDSSFGRYVHLTQNGALVGIGQTVTQGEMIALSGSSGTVVQHLHFDVTRECELRHCQTIPVFFRNTSPHPNGPVAGNAYTAGSY